MTSKWGLHLLPNLWGGSLVVTIAPAAPEIVTFLSQGRDTFPGYGRENQNTPESTDLTATRTVGFS